MTATVHVISDALGDTACEVVLAAAGQFREGSVRVARLPRVTGIDEVERYLAPHIASGEPIAVFHTIVDPELRSQLAFTLRHLDVPSVDLMGPALDTLSALLGDRPAGTPGVIHRTDERYFRRIEAMEYFVAHDDGRGADDLNPDLFFHGWGANLYRLRGQVRGRQLQGFNGSGQADAL